MSDWEQGARVAMRKTSLEEQSKIYKLAIEFGEAVDVLNARDGMEIVLKLGQYLARHPEGVRDGIHVEGQD